MCGNECIFQHPFFWFNWLGVNDEVLMLILDGILYWLVLFAIDQRSVRDGLKRNLRQTYKSFKSMFHGYNTKSFNLQTIKTHSSEDSDVSDERLRVEKLISSHHQCDEAIVVHNLAKRYSNGGFLAVDQISFGVAKEQFFGLLGINGAGKTTTFRMLTGDIPVTNGNAHIQNFMLNTDRAKYQSQIGYCPQFDALLDRLNSYETLYLFGRLRGITDDHIEEEVKKMIQNVDLTMHAKRKAKNYSGGNKRKLSLAAALIGSPPVVFLDEPSAGVDPVARRKMWVAISDLQYNSGSSIILCSHSMDECEALCDRIAIMAHGQFKCVGSTQYLRTKFGQGFSLVIKLKPDLISQDENDDEYIDKVQEYIETNLPKAQLKDIHQTLIYYHIPSDESTSWSKLFKIMELGKEQLNLEDYQVGDTTLEQIFLSFAKKAVRKESRAKSNSLSTAQLMA